MVGSPPDDRTPLHLVTPRLTLREFVLDDWQAVLDYQRDPCYLRFYHGEDRTEADAREFVAGFVASQRQTPRWRYQLAITLRGHLIGNCGIRVHDFRQREAHIGYELDHRFWGHGYGTEAAREIVRFGFETLNMHRIWAECVAENTASARVLERVGMQREGCLREKEFIKGRWHDRLIYAVLESEWAGLSGQETP